jgi:hypothetical protein
VNTPKKAPASNTLRGNEPIMMTFSPMMEAIVLRVTCGRCGLPERKCQYFLAARNRKHPLRRVIRLPE